MLPPKNKKMKIVFTVVNQEDADIDIRKCVEIEMTGDVERLAMFVSAGMVKDWEFAKVVSIAVAFNLANNGRPDLSSGIMNFLSGSK